MPAPSPAALHAWWLMLERHGNVTQSISLQSPQNICSFSAVNKSCLPLSWSLRTPATFHAKWLWLLWNVVINGEDSGNNTIIWTLKAWAKNLFKSDGNWLHSYSHAAQIFYDTFGCNFHLIMKGAVVIQHLSVVNTIRGDILVSRRGKKIWPNVENCGFSAGSEENGGWSDICLSNGGTEVSPHTNWKNVSKFKRVCNDTLLRLLMLIHTQAVVMFPTWPSRRLKDRAAGEKLTLIFDKMMILPWCCGTDMLAVLWCGFQHRLGVHLVGNDTRRHREG